MKSNDGATSQFYKRDGGRHNLKSKSMCFIAWMIKKSVAGTFRHPITITCKVLNASSAEQEQKKRKTLWWWLQAIDEMKKVWMERLAHQSCNNHCKMKDRCQKPDNKTKKNSM